MKKSMLVLLTLVPVAVGLVVNFTLFVPVVGSLLFFLLPLATTIFWFYLGSKYACSGWNAPCSILIGNAVGILSLAVYVWQCVLLTDENVNLFLAAASQMFSAATPTYLFGRLAMLFEAQLNLYRRGDRIGAAGDCGPLYDCNFWMRLCLGKRTAFRSQSA